MNRDRARLLAILAASVAVPTFGQTAPTPAQPLAEAPTAAAAKSPSELPPVVPNSVTVLAVTGKAGARRAAGEPIRPIKAGDQLGEGAEVITPAKSVVQIRIGENQVFSIDQLSRVTVKEAVARGAGVEKDTTTLDVPYGRVKFNIKSTEIANEVQITAPDATLAVKGTIGGIEVVAGQPTFAFGGELNNGRFEVRFGGRQRAVVTRAEKIDAKRPDAAAYERRQQYVETKDKKSREGDEEETVIANDQVFFALFERIVREAITTEPFDLFALDESTGSFGRTDIFGGSAERRIDTSNLNLNNGPGTGAAVLHDADGAFLLRLESSGSKGVTSRLLAIPLDGQNLPRGSFDLVAEYRSDGLLTGLGALQSRVFAVEDLGSEGRIVELPVPSGPTKGPIDVVQRMELGMRLDSGLAGVTSSGFLVAVGRLPDTGLSNGTPGVLGADAALLFLDPRNNYIAGAISDVNGLFQLTSGTDVSGGRITDTQRVTGVGTLAVPFIGQFVVLSTYSTVNGQANRPGFILLNLNSDLSNERPVVFGTGSLDAPIEGLAGEARGTPPAPRQLPLADLPSDPSLSPMFADLAYSQLAVASGVVERIARNAILQTARDPQGCRVSAELNANTLLVALFILSDHRAGMGQAISFFRNSLPANHPCLSPTMFIQSPGSPVMSANEPFVGPLDHVAMTQQFMMARYGQEQVASGVASHLAGELVAATASNPAACRASGELTGPRLADALAAGVNQPGGINQAVNQFRSGLPASHPCRTRQ